MSSNLDPIDLTGKAAGYSQTIPVSEFAGQRLLNDLSQIPHLQFFNETGCGLAIQTQSGQSFRLPAGGWRTVDLLPSDNQFTLTIEYTLPNAPVNLLLVTYFPPSEPVPDVGVLGNSPIGLSGQVSTNVNQLVNDGNAAGTNIIEATPSGQGVSSWSMSNDGSGFLQILSANVLRKILNAIRGDTGATKAVVTIGDSGDATISTFYGSLLGAQPATVGALTANSLASLNGQASAGAFGTPVIVAQTIEQHVTTTAPTNVMAYTPTTAGLYRISGCVEYNGSGGSAALVLIVGYGSPNIGGFNYPLAGLPFSGSATPELFSTFSWASGKSYPVLPATIFAKAGTAFNVTYTSPNATPNDWITIIIERLS